MWTVQLQQSPKSYLSSRTLEGLGLVQAFLYVAAGAESAYLPGVLAVWTGDVGNLICASRAFGEGGADKGVSCKYHSTLPVR